MRRPSRLLIGVTLLASCRLPTPDDGTHSSRESVARGGARASDEAAGRAGGGAGVLDWRTALRVARLEGARSGEPRVESGRAAPKRSETGGLGRGGERTRTPRPAPGDGSATESRSTSGARDGELEARLSERSRPRLGRRRERVEGDDRVPAEPVEEHDPAAERDATLVRTRKHRITVVRDPFFDPYRSESGWIDLDELDGRPPRR